MKKKHVAGVIGTIGTGAILFQVWCHYNIPESYRGQLFVTIDYLTDRRDRPVVISKVLNKLKEMY